ncbi:SBBP repeat-containing protein, partial [bacterium]|nr:SBBP repeat-containing protein [bacterium]
LVFSTFLGGSSYDYGYSLSLDGSGNCYVTGYTQSSDFPTTAGAYDTSGYSDAFVTKLNSSGSSLVFSTFLGGSGSNSDQGNSVSTDGSGNCYVTGYTFSSDFPTTVGAYDTSYNGSSTSDVFVTKLNSSGSSLIFSTFLGGSNYEESRSLSVDGSGNCYVTGSTKSSNFPTTSGAYDTSLDSYDTFVTKLNSSGSSLVFSTFLGGSSYDYGYSVSSDGNGNCFVTGQTISTGFPTTAGAYDTSNNGNGDAFVTKLNSSGNSLVYSTYLGGNGDETGYSLSLDGSGNCYVTGVTNSSDFPTTVGAYDTSHNGGYSDAFVTKFDLFTGIKEQNNLAKDFQLEQNFPNPFNPNTTISYTLAKTNNVKLEVYNTNGELVRTLVSEKQNAGSHTSNWNGKDERGNTVSSGVYFYRLATGSFTQTNKMVLLK